MGNFSLKDIPECDQCGGEGTEVHACPLDEDGYPVCFCCPDCNMRCWEALDIWRETDEDYSEEE